MNFEFEFNGGVRKPGTHETEKFLAFFVVGGKELPMYQLIRDNLILRSEDDPHKYFTGCNILKVFIGHQGFGVQRRYYSFYMQMTEEHRPTVRLQSVVERSPYYFSGKVHFLKKNQIVELLNPDQPSLQYLNRQAIIPVEVIRSLISVDRTSMKKGVRHVRVGKANSVPKAEDLFLD